MEKVVLDTSVILKLFLKESGSDIAIKLKDRHVKGMIEIIIPELLKYELINVLKYKGYVKEEIIEALEVIRDFGFSIIELGDVLFDMTAAFSVDYDISSYDATYVALAKKEDALLYTADKKLLSKIKKLKFAKYFTEF